MPGKQLGRKLGFPTANLRIERRRAPVQGIFAVRVHGVGGGAAAGRCEPGNAPHGGWRRETLLEAHVFDFSGDLYGREIEVEFVAKLRDEERFADLDALVAQMHRDAARGAPHSERLKRETWLTTSTRSTCRRPTSR